MLCVIYNGIDLVGLYFFLYISSKILYILSDDMSWTLYRVDGINKHNI